jgi:hypothetical protein
MFHSLRAVAVECCYQNTGIATSVAAAMFEGEELAVAVGVPLFYGICEAVFLAIYCITCWKLGWTKAPVQENICTVLFTSYEVKELMDQESESIEVMLGNVQNGPSDLIFSRTKEGYQIDEISLESLSNAEDGEFTIDDDDDMDQDNNVEVDVAESADLESPHNDLHHRSRRTYETVDLSSPQNEKVVAKSPIANDLQLPLDSGQTGVKKAVSGALSSLSSLARGGNKYAMASVVGNEIARDVPVVGKEFN